ncbi:MAG: hypothetical protein ACRDK9_00140 [Solirubrobacterales bacterium]
MSAFYELIGRIVVRLAWARYGRQLTIAGAILGAVAAAVVYAVATREPPEG